MYLYVTKATMFYIIILHVHERGTILIVSVISVGGAQIAEEAREAFVQEHQTYKRIIIIIGERSEANNLYHCKFVYGQ